jgi:hypothetical protein
MKMEKRGRGMGLYLEDVGAEFSRFGKGGEVAPFRQRELFEV